MTSTDASSTTWDSCLSSAAWLSEPLHRILHYPAPLPVQQVVVPAIMRAFRSGVPNDISLTAPTGSGKTLCYLLPLLSLLTEAKRGVDDTALRCLLLVPTPSLGQQVYRELQRLTRHTTILAACICGDMSAVEELETGVDAQLLVRRVEVPQLSSFESLHASDFSSVEAEMCPQVRYYSAVDILVATPQRLLHCLDTVPGMSLAKLRLLVIDEADQVLAGNFSSFVQKVMSRYDEEVDAIVATNRAAAVAAASTPFWCPAKTIPAPVLHKVLCSATLSSRIARISQVPLRNCTYYVLDTNGVELSETVATSSPTVSSSTTASGQRTGGVVRMEFALPPTLQEHILFVEDAYRHAVLLKLVTTLLRRMKETRQHRRPRIGTELRHSTERDDGEEPAKLERSSGDATSAPPGTKAAMTTQESYPAVQERAGTGILVFCATAEEARVMGHFLAAAGVPSVVEFTTLSSESERRRALLQQSAADDPLCLVASDALMRGIDIPNIGHVIMYHPPDAISQYVHRAGRTARAMRPGHVHLLLSKNGPSGTPDDGEVAKYKQLATQLSQTLPVSFERTFFRFRDRHGDTKRATTAPVTPSAVPSGAFSTDDAEWWVEQANQFLQQSQNQLQRRWASVMESLTANPVLMDERVGKETMATAVSATIGGRKRGHEE